jgi:hypothetical protein
MVSTTSAMCGVKSGHSRQMWRNCHCPQKDFCSPENAMFPHYCLVVVKLVTKPWHKIQEENSIIYSFHWDSVIPCGRVCLWATDLRNSRRELWNTLYFDCCLIHNFNRATWSGIVYFFRTSLREFLVPVVTNTSHRKQETFLYEYRLILSPFAHNNYHSVVYPQARSSFWLLKPASEQAQACLLPRLSWSWTVRLT